MDSNGMGESTKSSFISERHKLCLKRLQPSLLLDIAEIQYSFTMAVKRRLLVRGQRFDKHPIKRRISVSLIEYTQCTVKLHSNFQK